MAGEWIKWSKGLSTRREVLAIAAALAIDRRLAAAVCMEFWEWADANTEDGALPGVTLDAIDAIVSMPGFGKALQQVGWLTNNPPESPAGLLIPRYDRHNGSSAKRRLAAAEKKRVQRRPSNGPGPVPDRSPQTSPQVSPVNGDRKGTGRGTRGEEEERERRGEDLSGSGSEETARSLSLSVSEDAAAPEGGAARRKAEVRYIAAMQPLLGVRSRRKLPAGSSEYEADVTCMQRIFADVWPDDPVGDEHGPAILRRVLDLIPAARRRDTPMAWLQATLKRQGLRSGEAVIA